MRQERLFDSGWSLSCRSPIELNSQYAPEPDLAVIRGDRKDYFPRFPGAEAVELVIEIAEAALPQRLEVLRSSYAEQEIPEFWIVNLQTEEVEIHDRPQRELQKYARCRKFNRDEAVDLKVPGLALPELPVRALLDATLK